MYIGELAAADGGAHELDVAALQFPRRVEARLLRQTPRANFGVVVVQTSVNHLRRKSIRTLIYGSFFCTKLSVSPVDNSKKKLPLLKA